MPSANSPEVVNSQPISSPVNNGFGCAAASLHALVAVFSRRRQKKPDNVHDSNADAEEVMNFHPVQLKTFSLGQLKTFSLRELQIATDNFNPKSKGGFGIVYKGRLRCGSLVAVKKSIEKHIQIGNSQFQIELQMIAMAVHRHIIRLHGFCVTSTERLLVYPFMANGSVESWLRGRPQTKPPLDWKVRQRIALGAAKGLAYLHDHCIPKIIHRDVKAANILLDEAFEAIVADFGLVKLMDHKVTHITTEARGTPGYIAPECIFKKESSEKTDIYGYGVMLLELISAQRISDLASLAEASSKNEEDLSLMAWLKGLVEDKKLEIIIDEELQGSYVEEEVDKLTQIALLCTQERPKKRPKMSEVVTMLEGDVFAERWEEWKKDEMFRQAIQPS